MKRIVRGWAYPSTGMSKNDWWFETSSTGPRVRHGVAVVDDRAEAAPTPRR